MSTLADIRKAAEADVFVSTDDQTPAGTFSALTKIDGYIMTYLLLDGEDRETAPILGRVEDHNPVWPFKATRMYAYVGDRLRGGLLVRFESYEDAFARMAATA